jgi:hypothetical protein
MLAPFAVNLLLSCVLLLLFGWALDLINGWMDSHVPWTRQWHRRKTAGTMGLVIHRAVSDSTTFAPVCSGMTAKGAKPMPRRR